MKKTLIIFAFLFFSLFGIYKVFQNPEKILIKKTKHLINLSSIQSGKSDMALIAKTGKIAKLIHYDVQFKAEYEGKDYKARSLNEFRSLLNFYFKRRSTGKFEYKNLTVQMKDDNKTGEVNFEALFERSSQKISCKAMLKWLKDKKWFVKKIEIHSCYKIN